MSPPDIDGLPLRGIQKVAIIGAGISGITSAAHLLRQGLDVTVFERSSIAGGVWHYDPRPALEPPYPSVKPPPPNSWEEPDSSADAAPQGPPGSAGASFEAASLLHAPPGPCYKGLRNNVPTTLMRSTLLSWPEGTPEIVSQDLLEKYVRDLAEHTGAQRHILYDTSVESIAKSEDRERDHTGKWRVRTRTLHPAGGGRAADFVTREWDDFDAVVVASGHYHVPRVPDVPGLREWKARFPDGVMHSKGYRTPERFRGKTVLLVGAGVSSLDIARESAPLAEKVYQSARGGDFDVPAHLLPPGVERVGGLERFVPSSVVQGGSGSGDVVLEGGKVLRGVDAIVLGTGYITSYPFLGRLQDPTVPVGEASDELIVSSDVIITHNLFKDIFYISDPSLVFVGVPYYTSTFSLFDFQAEVVARVFAGKTRLPRREEMRRDYDTRKLGLTDGNKTFHSLLRKEVPYMNGILEWVNRGAASLGFDGMRGVDERWLERYATFMEEMKRKRAVDGVEQPGKEILIPLDLRSSVGVASA